MRHPTWAAALLVALAVGARGTAGEPPCCCEPPGDSFLQRISPVGGWHPDDGGLLHWWPQHCFRCSGAPDDYCRKKPPRVCWPPYPPYYIWGPPEICHPQCNAPPNCNKPRIAPPNCNEPH